MKKTFIKYLFVFCCLLFISSLKVEASEAHIDHEATYDLEQGGTQKFTIYNDAGEPVSITISEEPNISRVSNGTYKVSYDASPSWKAGFYVVISNNCITTAKNKFVTVILGTLYEDKLVKESTKQASYYINYRYLTTFYNVGVRAKISGTTLKVSAI